MINRKDGWYWVRYQDDDYLGDWEIAHWAYSYFFCNWSRLSSDDSFVDSDFHTIDETPIDLRYQ